MKVLFCTDGSDTSFYAIGKALKFLKADDQIDIITIIDWGLLPTYVTFPHEEEVESPNQKSIAEDTLNKTRNFIESKGHKITKSEYSYGHPEVIILELIKEENYDMVVMGSHGKKGIRKWLGSVSRKVIMKSPVPTFIARPPLKPETEYPKETKEAIIAVDGSKCSFNAIKKATELLNLNNVSVDLLTIRPGVESLPLEITMDNEWLENCIEKQKDIANEILEKSNRILQENGITARESYSLEGDAAESILDFINHNKNDLVIMGSHGREGLSDILIGSVSKRVLDNATSPVLIIPSKQI